MEKKTGKENSYLGRAGEQKVSSDLLRYGYNPGVLSLDYGIDLIAEKSGKFYLIQVKTSNYFNKNVGHFLIPFTPEKFKKLSENRVNLVVVLYHDFWETLLVLPPSFLSELVNQKKGVVKYLKVISEFNQRGFKKVFLGSKKLELTKWMNNFDILESLNKTSLDQKISDT